MGSVIHFFIFNSYCSVTYHGEYKNGEKYGKWTIEDKENKRM